MPKHEFLTPKAIANRIKAKGLQKLRWYCQMCQKQCRDENGFKCHCESESHQRQLALFAERPDKFLDHFSEEFLEGFMDVVKRRYAKTRVLANVVYNDYIHDRHHVHMNSTKWETLTALVKWLGKEGYCTVDHTPKGWYLTYIDRDPVAIERQKALERKERADLDDEERQKKIIEKQIEEAARLRQDGEPEFTELQRDETDDAKVVFALSSKAPDKPASKALPFETMLPPKPRPPALSTSSPLPKAGPSSDSESERQAASGALPREIKAESSRSGEKDTKRKISAAEELMLEEEKKKEKKKRRDHWLAPDIVVKVMNEKLAGGKYYKQKGVVEKVIDKYVGEVRMLDTGHRLRIDQEQLETVIPAVGGRVKVVNGAYAGETAVLQSIDVDKFCAQIKIDKGLLMGRVITAEYEDISKLFS